MWAERLRSRSTPEWWMSLAWEGITSWFVRIYAPARAGHMHFFLGDVGQYMYVTSHCRKRACAMLSGLGGGGAAKSDGPSRLDISFKEPQQVVQLPKGARGGLVSAWQLGQYHDCKGAREPDCLGRSGCLAGRAPTSFLYWAAGLERMSKGSLFYPGRSPLKYVRTYGSFDGLDTAPAAATSPI